MRNVLAILASVSTLALVSAGCGGGGRRDPVCYTDPECVQGCQLTGGSGCEAGCQVCDEDDDATTSAAAEPSASSTH